MPDDAAPPENAPPLVVCPYCGGSTPDQARCTACHGPLDPLSRQATQNAMGPWFVRDELQPHRPGCSIETIGALIRRGKITPDSILRGPTTAQFWYPARRVPGVANRLGLCHVCQTSVAGESTCPSCHASFEIEGDRQTLGLMPVRHIPGAGATAPVESAASPPPIHREPQTPDEGPPARRLRPGKSPVQKSAAPAFLLASLALLAIATTAIIMTRSPAATPEPTPRTTVPERSPAQTAAVGPAVSMSQEIDRPATPPAAAPKNAGPSEVRVPPLESPHDRELQILRTTRLP